MLKNTYKGFSHLHNDLIVLLTAEIMMKFRTSSVSGNCEKKDAISKQMVCSPS